MALQNAFGDLNLEATQLDIKAAVQALKSSNEALIDLVQQLQFLNSIKGPAANVRVSITDGAISSLPTLGTVSTVSNVGSVGGYAANTMVLNAMNSNACCANIQNVIIS